MTALRLWTVGHSNHTMERFLELLAGQRIQVLVDVRSSPYSRYSSHFNRGPLEKATEEAGIRYLFLGRELGGRPSEETAYDAEGHARYDVMAASTEFLGGLKRLARGVDDYRVAIMCSEGDPTDCHRRLLVGKVLTDQGGYRLHHLRGDGRVDEEEAVELDDPQLSLLGETAVWRSTQSVSQRSRHDSSSSS
jgi:uncharacterized protein (DUF488 family)